MQQQFCETHGVRLHGYLADRDGSEGISHSIMAERYVRPGQLVVGTDSHTPHCGALGALAFGIGTTEMANAWMTGEVRVEVPRTCRVRLNGRLPAGVEAKDIVLHLLRLPYVREGRAIGQVFEYCGEALSGLSTDERATLTNMVAEIGGFSGIVVPDEETQRFVQGAPRRRSAARAMDVQRRRRRSGSPHRSRVRQARADAGEARRPGRGVAISELAETVGIDIAYGGSCTGGKREDLLHYHAVLEWAAQRGMRVAAGTRFFLQFGSQDVRDYCVQNGMLDVFERVGVELVEPGCGACVNAGPGVSERADQVTVSAINRNFPGRSGPGQVWLASPSTVAASAIAGRIVSFRQLRALKAGEGDTVPDGR